MRNLLKMIRTGMLIPLLYLHPLIGLAQDCSTLNYTVTTKESRCIATGSIKVNITGGSGAYNIKVTGPVTTAYTSSTTISGLSAGTYSVSVKDINTGCVTDKYNIVVPGSYADPRFILNKTDVTCMNGADGIISVTGLQNGRSPFIYTIVAPSPSKVGTTNSTGNFSGLIAGEYAIELKDSCGGQQTRRVTILNYQWWVDGVTVGRVGCDSAQVTVKLKDSKGNTTIFNGFKYGVVRSTGDTVWSTNSNFRFYIGNKRSVKVVVKDPCGITQVTNWVDPNVPTVDANVTTSNFACNTFTATIAGTKLTNPSYKLFNSSNVQIANNTNGIFTGLAYGSYCIEVKDNCYDTTIRRCFSASRPKPAVAANATISNRGCTTFDAAISGQTNITNPTYGLYNSSNTLIATSPNGVFTGIPYGSYCIKIKDGCYDTTITRCFTEKKLKPSVDLNINTSGGTCTGFTGSVTGQTNLVNPQYCLYNSSNVLIACNTTGSFGNLQYNTRYCMRIKNDASCYDTTIERCFIIPRQLPAVGTDVDITQNCNSFDVEVTDQENLENPNYCLYNANNVKIACNTTGIFTNLPYGYYCITIANSAACYDTVIRRCFNPVRPRPSLSATVNISNRGCDGVTAKVSGSNLTNPRYILYNAANVAIDSNSTGTFNNVPYGYNCIRVRNTCYDTLMERCFTVKRNVPVGGSVAISNKVCATFTGKVTGQSNLINPQYFLYDTLGTFITKNTNGTFNNLPYGYYDVKIVDTCYDTVIVRRFNAAPVPITISVTAMESCTFGTTDIKVIFNTGNAPYKVQVLNPVGVLVTSTTSATSPVLINALPPLTNGQQYTVIGIDNCNVRDTAQVTPKPSILNKTQFVKSKCPSGVWENGATDIDIDVNSNMGVVTPVIIKKNTATVNIKFTSNVGSSYKFVDLEPASYVIQYSVPNCTGRIYDTVDVVPYSFPGLQQSAAYQCDNNNFSVGAAVTGGTGPFSYEIIGSIPASPSINSAGQTSPVFTITNGVQYSLVRLRAVDACGNATLNDVNILPLANTLIYASSDCYYNDIVLHVDSTANATYKWYKRKSATDSVLVSTTTSYRIPYLLPSDTGVYVCRMSVNGGCLTKLSYFTVTGMCSGTLPGQVRLAGKEINGTVQLNWAALQDVDTKEYIIERSSTNNGTYTPIGKVNARQLGGRIIYAFTDETPMAGSNYYRLQIVGKDNKSVYSNIIHIKTAAVSSISLYPNPAKKVLNISFSARQPESYKLSLVSAAGLVVHEQLVQKVQQATIQFHRPETVKTGVYMLRIIALNSQETYVHKVIFE